MGDIARVQVIIPYSSGVPTDVITNTWHFESLADESITSAKLATLFSRLQAFYGTVYTNTAIKAMNGYLNPQNTVMKGYNLSDPKPRTAVREAVTPINAGVLQFDTTPAEASIVLSYHTAYESGIPKASQRGRIYLGGLTAAYFDPSIGARSSQVKLASRDLICTAATTLFTQTLSDEWGWVVYSEKRGEHFAVAGGWVDNAIDTQRRRGQAATSTSLFST